MSKKRFSAEQLCKMYPEKYIAVNHISKDEHNVIVGAEVLKVYETLEECKKYSNEIKFYMKLYKDDFDIIFGDYYDYLETRTECGVIEIPFDEFSTIRDDGTIVIDAFKAFGAIAFEMFGHDDLDILEETNREEGEAEQNEDTNRLCDEQQ